MDQETKAPVELAIAHVLFIDIVGYSKLRTAEQNAAVATLNDLVQGSESFRVADKADRLLKIPTGDGMALVFYSSPEEPVQCAVALTKALKRRPQLQVRMGVHSGSVSGVVDVSGRANVAGAGINIAQRVMDCGDGGHILLSRHAADDLAEYERWRPMLHDLGQVEVKHGVTINVVNFVSDDVGNGAVPAKIQRCRTAQAARVRRRVIACSLGAITVAAAIGSAFWIQSRRAALAPSPGELLKSIAVLPLENLSEDKADAFFADGIQDDVLTSLSKISDLKVISRTSVMQYRGAKRNLRDIGHALGVGNILEGSVRRVGNRVLVTVQLIDAIHDRHLWAERYDRTLTDSIGLQGELATQIAHALRATLDPGEKTRLGTRPTDNAEAYVLYLKAREKERTAASGPDAFAIDAIYEQAIALDPKFGLAIARQAMWNSVMYMVGRLPERKVKAHALGRQALRVAPDLPEAHIAQGTVLRMVDRDYEGALSELSIAGKMIPNDPELLGGIATLYRRQGRWAEAMLNFRRLEELDPGVPHVEVASIAVQLRDWDTAIAGYRRALQIAPDAAEFKMALAHVLMIGPGDFAQAKAIVAQVPIPRLDNRGQPSGDDFVLRWQLSMLERDFPAANKVLDEFVGEEFPSPFPGWKAFARACTALAAADSATARSFFEKARPFYEAGANARPDEPKFLAPLGLVDAYLGRKDDAVRESERALDLLPQTDVIERPAYVANLALVYGLTGQSDKAVSLIEQLLTKPLVDGELLEPMTLSNLRSWTWDLLRGNPRFEKILASPEPKTLY